MTSPAHRLTNAWVPIDIGTARHLSLPKQALVQDHLFAADVRFIRDTSVWVELPFAKRWVAAFRVVTKGGVSIIAELRAFPADVRTGAPAKKERRPPGWWHGMHGGSEGVPRGGLTARALREVRLKTFKQALQAILTRHGAAFTERASPTADLPKPRTLVEDFPDLPQATPQPIRRGRKGRSITELAQIALTYEQAWLKNKPPVQAVAKQFRLSRTQARDAVYRARTCGMLSPTDRQGSAMGARTERARSVLARLKPNKEPRGERSCNPCHG